nr:phage antirepressor KilAC domain-containing protein [Eubacterium sp. 1001713B170207_170306_E7]
MPGGGSGPARVWFVARDVCAALGFKDTSHAVKRHAEAQDTAKRRIIDARGRRMPTTVINESGLYALIMGSCLPAARQFKHYVTSVILPSVSRHGAHVEDAVLSQVRVDRAALDTLIATLSQESEKRQSAETALEQQTQESHAWRQAWQRQQPDVRFASDIKASVDSITVGAMAKLIHHRVKDMGQNRLFAWMRAQGYLCRRKAFWNDPTQRALELGVLELYEGRAEDKSGRTRLYRKPVVTARGQQYFMEVVTRHYSRDYSAEAHIAGPDAAVRL